MLEKLGSALKNITNKIARAVFLDRREIERVAQELERALIGADVNMQLAKEIADELKKRASDEKIRGVEKREQIIKYLNDKIIEILGGEKQELLLNGEEGKQTRIMMVGLYGAGKTTTIGKLALYYSKRGKKVAVVGLDVHRPAAPEQLEQISKKAKIVCFTDKTEKDAVKIWEKYRPELNNYDIVIIDTAGRHSLDKGLVKEIKELTKEIEPEYKILVIQADIGQAAKQQAAEFQKSCKINGVIITRMDSTAKAGGALTACYETKAPVFFIGTGEKLLDLEQFNPKTFVSRMLGLGDIESLIEKVQTAVDKNEQKRLEKELEKGRFTLRDFQKQIASVSSMGSLNKIAELIPGFSKIKDKLPKSLLGAQENKMKKWAYVIDSMTEQEIENPELIEKQTTRLGRIAKGSGATTTDVRQLLKQYKIIREFAQSGKDMSEMGDAGLGAMSGISQKQMMKLAKKFGKKMRI